MLPPVRRRILPNRGRSLCFHQNQSLIRSPMKRSCSFTSIQSWLHCEPKSWDKSVRNSSKMTIPRPISESYWVEPGQFLAGEYPARFDAERTRKRIDALIEAGFEAFIDLTQDGETFRYKDILLEQAEVYAVKVT